MQCLHRIARQHSNSSAWLADKWVLCLLYCKQVAEGVAHVYPRLARTCEWDTAAAHAIVEEAGGCVLQAGSCDSKGKLLEDWKVGGHAIAEGNAGRAAAALHCWPDWSCCRQLWQSRFQCSTTKRPRSIPTLWCTEQKASRLLLKLACQPLVT